MPDIRAVVERIAEVRARVAPARSVLVAVSGIDASGKGFVTARLAEALRGRALRVAAINVDGWLNLPDRRFSAVDPGAHYYRHAIRFDTLFAELILPLRERRSLRVEVDHAEETSTAYLRRLHAYDDIDVILLEGILLLKPELRGYYDLSVWIECSFATALERALPRAQEGLSPQDTIRVYETTYFPAQRIHFARDDPRQAATLIVDNDLPRPPVEPRPAR
jgi:uridine kinase